MSLIVSDFEGKLHRDGLPFLTEDLVLHPLMNRVINRCVKCDSSIKYNT